LNIPYVLAGVLALLLLCYLLYALVRPSASDMSAPLQFALLGALVLAFVILCARPLGIYMADVMEGKPNFALRWGAPLERWIYRACGIDARSKRLVDVYHRTAGLQFGGRNGGLRAAAAAAMAAL